MGLGNKFPEGSVMILLRDSRVVKAAGPYPAYGEFDSLPAI